MSVDDQWFAKQSRFGFGTPCSAVVAVDCLVAVVVYTCFMNAALVHSMVSAGETVFKKEGVDGQW
jgi:hypothetical protein